MRSHAAAIVETHRSERANINKIGMSSSEGASNQSGEQRITGTQLQGDEGLILFFEICRSEMTLEDLQSIFGMLHLAKIE
jgi:hypothetical protein